MLATGDTNGTGILWDLRSGKKVTLVNSDVGIRSVAISCDGIVAFGKWDGNIDVFNIKQPEDITTFQEHIPNGFQGHVRDVKALAFAPDGKTLASTSWDGTIKLWNVATGKPALTLKSRGPGTDVVFSDDGMLMVTCGADGAVRLWPADSLSQADSK